MFQLTPVVLAVTNSHTNNITQQGCGGTEKCLHIQLPK